MNAMRTRAWHSLGSGLLWAIVLSGCASSSPPSASVANTSNPATVDAEVVQSLRRQIRERDQRIAELTSQLETLKVIDQDVDERRKSRRLPATLTPAE
jgi:hypothetical protein